MKPHIVALVTAFLFAGSALAQGDGDPQAQQQGDAQAQEGNSQAQQGTVQEDGNVTLVKRVQVALHLHGFDPGPVNGQLDGPTQAALARFQLQENLPASAALDDATLKALGVSRDLAAMASEDENASAGAGMPLARP